MGTVMTATDTTPKPDFFYECAVRWSEICGLQDIHFSQWLRYMEEAEYAFLRSRGLSVVLSDAKGQIGFPRIACRLNIHGQAAFEQPLRVEVSLSSNDGKRLIYEFRAFNQARLLADARFEVACCRFPTDELPYAILIPDWVMARLGAR
jgi:acyl-CoA thioesterase FadM